MYLNQDVWPGPIPTHISGYRCGNYPLRHRGAAKSPGCEHQGLHRQQRLDYFETDGASAGLACSSQTALAQSIEDAREFYQHQHGHAPVSSSRCSIRLMPRTASSIIASSDSAARASRNFSVQRALLGRACPDRSQQRNRAGAPPQRQTNVGQRPGKVVVKSCRRCYHTGGGPLWVVPSTDF